MYSTGMFCFGTDGVEPRVEGECHDALSERVVKHCEDVLADPEGVG